MDERVRRLAVRLLRVPCARVIAPVRGSSAAIDRAAAGILHRGVPLVVCDTARSDPGIRRLALSEQWESVLAAPIAPRRDAAPAVLLVADAVRRIWSEDDVTTITDLAALAAAASGVPNSVGAPSWLARIVQRETNLARRNSEGWLTPVVARTTDMILLVSVEKDGFRCLAVNDACLAIATLSESQVIGRRIEDIVAPEAAGRLTAQLAAVVSGAKSVRDCDFPLPQRQLVVETTLTPIFDRAGVCTHVLGVGRAKAAPIGIH